MYNSQTGPMKSPENTGELLKYIFRKIPERLLRALPMTIIIGAVSWLLHTYLLVYTNEGFNPDTWLGQNLLNVQGRLVSSTLLWTMVGAVIPMVISFFAHGGNPVKSFSAMVKMPGTILAKNKASNFAVLPMVLISCGITLLFDKLISGVAGLVAGGIVMSSVIAFVTGRGSVFIQVLRMAFTDVQTFLLKKQKLRLDGDSVYLVVGSSGVALVVYGIIKSLGIFPFVFGKLGALLPLAAGFFNVLLVIVLFLFNSVWWILLVVGIVLIIKNKNASKKLAFFAGFFLAVFAADHLAGTRIFADDGGWIEAGGSFAAWIASEGAFRAVLSGLPPALGGLIGSYVSSILNGLFSGFGPVDPGTPVAPTQPTAPAEPAKPGQEPVMSKEEFERMQQLKEQERLRQEQEQLRIREEFERKRLLEMQKQQDIRNKALEEKRKLEEQRANYLAMQARLCAKYNTTPDKLMEVLQANNAANQDEARRLNNTARNWELAYKAAVVTVAACDATIDGLATVTGPAGKWVRGTYKVVQGVAVGAAEASVDGKSVSDGMVSGLIKGGANAASDFVSNPVGKAVLTVGSETAAGAVTDGVEGAQKGLVNGIYSAGVNAITDKIGGDGFGNEVSTVGLPGGKTALTMTTSSGQVVTKTVSDNVANTFIKNKITNQVIQSGVKGGGAVISELGVKPALQDRNILPK